MRTVKRETVRMAHPTGLFRWAACYLSAAAATAGGMRSIRR